MSITSDDSKPYSGELPPELLADIAADAERLADLHECVQYRAYEDIARQFKEVETIRTAFGEGLRAGLALGIESTIRSVIEPVEPVDTAPDVRCSAGCACEDEVCLC